MEETKVVCARCGHKWTVNRPKMGRTDLLCRSCRATKQNVIEANGFKCLPWQGEFAADLVTPMLNGNIYLPGNRICGNRDCTNINHIEM